MAGNSHFLVVGESVVDVIVDASGAATDHAGGSPANVAVGLGRLGEQVGFVTELGEDAGGELLRRHLTASRVDVLAQPVARTPVATATRAADGSVGYDFDLGWTLRPFDAAPDVSVVHVGSLGAVVSPGAAAVSGLLEGLDPKVTVSYDPNCRPALMGSAAAARTAVEGVVARADLVKVSDEDLAWLYPGAPVEEVAASWHAIGPGAVVVTLGRSGSYGYVGSGSLRLPSVRVQVADTVGAGDSFMAGLLHYLDRHALLTPECLRRLTIEQLRGALAFAADVAAVTCSRPGADPPWRIELTAPLAS